MSIQLSYSASQKYLMSPRAYYLHYVLRLRSSNLSSALFFGNAMDIALNELLNQKMNNEEIDTKSAIRKFLLSWSRSVVDGEELFLNKPGVIKFSKSDLDESLLNEIDERAIESGVDKSWLSMAKKGAMMIEAYAEQIIPKIQEVFFVQKNIKLENADGDSFVGVIDFCARWEDGKVYIFDNKTTSVKYKEDAVQSSEQLSTYVEAMKDDVKIDGAGYITIPKKMRKQKIPLVPIEVILGEIDDEFIEKTFQMYDEVLHGIKMGRFPCTPEKCAETPWGCGYELYCESDGQDLTGLKFFKKSER